MNNLLESSDGGETTSPNVRAVQASRLRRLFTKVSRRKKKEGLECIIMERTKKPDREKLSSEYLIHKRMGKGKNKGT